MTRVRWILLVAVALAALSAGLALGSLRLSPNEVLASLLGNGDPVAVQIVRELRAPRAVLAFLVGGTLGLAGAALQALLRNPLADPQLLGISGGAGLGVVLAIAAGVGTAWGLPAAAFGGAIVAMVFVYRLGLVAGGVLDVRILLLAGVVVGSFAAAITQGVVSLTDAAQLRNAMLWLWGGFSAASWQATLVFAAYAVVPAWLLLSSARALDLFTLGEEPARYLGADVERLKRRVWLAAALLTAAGVAVSGVIGFVGLVVPNAVRLVLGHVHRSLLPAVLLAGGAFLVLADAAARTALAPRELPVGIVTALVGVPVFALLLRRGFK